MNIFVIIPVYNAEKYLQQAVDSVLNQPFKNIQIVLVNDGSIDGSALLCNQIAEKEERVSVIHQENQGVSVARNIGIEYVLRNEKDNTYIAFLDADDAWSKDFVSDDIIDLLNKNDLNGFLTVRCNDTLTRFKQPTYMCEGVIQGGAKSIWCHATQTFGAMFYSIELIKKHNIRFISGLKINEDRIFMMKCAYFADSISLNNKKMYLYRNNQFSTSHNNNYGIKKYYQIIDEYLNLDKEMAECLTETKGDFNEGTKMAAIYVIDMLAEHFSNMGHKDDIECFFENHKYMCELFQTPLIKSVGEIIGKWERINNNYQMFIIENKLKGIVYRLIKRCYNTLYRVDIIKYIIDFIRYPNLL